MVAGEGFIGVVVELDEVVVGEEVDTVEVEAVGKKVKATSCVLGVDRSLSSHDGRLLFSGIILTTNPLSCYRTNDHDGW